MDVRLWTLVAALFLRLCVWAQSEAAIRVSEGGYGMVKTNVTVGYEHTWGRVTDGFSARVSYEFLRKRYFTLSANLRYCSVSTSFLNSDLVPDYAPDEINLNGIHTMEHIGMTATARTRLFGRPLLGLGMVNSEWGVGGFNHVSATFMAMLMLRANRATQFGIGVLGMVNTTSKMPVFPVFIYRHRFDARWLLNLYGGMFGIDYTPTRNDLFSARADVDVKSFYFRPHTRCNFQKLCCRRYILNG